MKKRMALAALGVVLVAGCGGGGSSGDTLLRDPSPGEPMAHNILEQVTQSGLGGQERNVVVDNQEDWRAFWARHKAGQPGADTPPPVDFTRETVVALVQTQGSCNTRHIADVQVAAPTETQDPRPVARVTYYTGVLFCIPAPIQPVLVARIDNPARLKVEFRLQPPRP